ncbi:MAG: DUF2341 domain-containing protein, partial [Promethearchaeota archaeon]
SSPPTNSDNIFFFYDGFESGNLNGWDANSTGSAGDSIIASTDQAHTGNYSAKCDMDDVASPQAMVYEDFPDEASLFARVHIYLDPSLSITDRITVMQFIDTSSGWQNLISVTIDQDMTLYMWNAVIGEAYGYGGGGTISLGSWHTLDVQVNVSDNFGMARLWLDGNLEIDNTSIDLGTEPTDRFATGIYWAGDNEFNTLFIDDIHLRLSVEPEPIVTLGEEEISRPSPNYFNYYKEITIDHTKVSGASNLTDFPVLISILDTDLYDKVQSNGNDIAFYNGTDWLDHEIEVFNQTYSGTQAQLIAWVRTPSLSPTTDTKIYMYYGNSTMSSQENPTGVWDSNYLGVWHLSEDPTGTVYDSTTNNNDGSSYGSMDSGDQILGKIDGSINFDGNDDNIATEDNNLLAGRSSFTMSAWIKPLSTQSDFCGIIEYDNTTDGNSFDAAMELRSTRVPRVNIWTTSGFEYVDSSTVLPTTQFTYFVFVYDGDLNIYLDGSFDSSTPHSGNVRNNRRHINIGRNTHDGRSFNGIIDDVHISSIDRSADWIATEYNNQYDPSSFYSIGTEERVGLSIDDFNYNKEITIDHTKVSGSSNLINFPVLISILDTDLHDKVQSNGNDIAFYNGTQWLDHEIEVFNQTYSGTQAQLVAWVRIPSLSPTTDTKIYMYYGNSTMGPQENPTGVWDSNYQAIWHLSEDPSGTAPQILDSTLNNYDGTSFGSMTSEDQRAGQIDGCLDFDGSDDEVNPSGVVIGDLAAWTLSAWIRMGADTADQRTIYSEGDTVVSDYLFLYVDDINSDVRFYSETATGDWSQVIGSTDVEDNQWHLVTLVQRSKTDRELFVDSLSEGTSTHNAGTLTTDTASIGALNYIWGSADWFNGTIDEVRISNINRSNDWIITEYNNQYDPSSFYTVGDDAGPSVDDFNYFKEITIDHTKVSGSSDLINFPVLISILDTDLHDKVQSNGNDIAFYNGTNWLDHEIEVFNQTYSGTEAQLVAWVRIPSLSPTTDTKIYMYYGNSTMGPQENPTGVWDANYVGVWHLSEDPTDQIYDSTENNNDGTSYGTMNTGDQVSGKIDGSLEFDGIDDYIDCGNNLSLDITGDLTIQYWVMAYDVSNDPDTITKGVYTDAYSSFINNDRTIYFRLNGLTSTNLQSQTLISLDKWVSITCTRIGNTMRIFINGTQDPTTATFSEAIEIITDALTIARSPDNLDGVMDEARLSNIARTEDWIATEYNNQYDPSSFYTVGNDTKAPDITINSPNTKEFFGSNAPSYNLTVTDLNLDSIWYSLDGGANSTPVSETGIINQAMWSGRPNGTVTIRFYANDTFGNLNYSEVVVRKDIVNPSIDSIDSPSVGTWFNSVPPGYSLSITEANLDEIWYTLDGGINNYTGALSGTIDS